MTTNVGLTATPPRSLEDERRYQAEAFGLDQSASWTAIQQAVRSLPEDGFVNYEDWVNTMNSKGARLRALA
jgi:hypothetical protein